MNTSALKLFAQQARRQLRQGVERRLTYWGFDKNGNNTERLEAVAGGYTFRGKVNNDTSEPGKWSKLKAAISTTSLDEVVEKAAYTWFNRLVAIKILSQNGYETAQLDYLSKETNTPAVLEKARRGHYSFLNTTEQKRLQLLLTDYEKEQEAFAILLIGFCHQHPLLQGIFGSIDDYTELLLPDDILTENGFLYFLNTTDAISEEDYKQVELIGWLYQFYISEKKDEVFASFKENKKAEAKDIPAATQIFTPNWIAKYLVQNTLGRTWLDAHPDSDLKKDWKYLVEASRGNEDHAIPNTRLLTPDSLTFLDPAVGSGHILVEAFDTLYHMYLADYYSPEEAVQSILEKNLFGLDLDLRAVQLSQFALVLKAAQYSRSILQGKTLPHVYAMPQHRAFSKEEAALFLGQENAGYVNQLYKALQTMEQAHNLGSIMTLELNTDGRKEIEERYQYWREKIVSNFDEQIIKEFFSSYIPILLILTSKFTCVGANPPYMGLNNMNTDLLKYSEDNYWDSRHDLSNIFYIACIRLLEDNGIIAMINQQSWMFAKSYIELRKYLLTNVKFNSLIHLGANAFPEIKGEVVQTVAFSAYKTKGILNRPIIFRLVDFESSPEKEKAFLKRIEKYTSLTQSEFLQFEEHKFQYGVHKNLLTLIRDKKFIKKDFETREGLTTGNNEIFIRYFFEVSANKLGSKWIKHVKGGDYRKWYGNLEFVLNWENGGYEVKNNKTKDGRVRSHNYNEDFLFKKGFTWGSFGRITSFRYVTEGLSFDSSGSMGFHKKENETELITTIAFLNSKVVQSVMPYIKGNNNAKPGHISLIPYDSSFMDKHKSKIEALSTESIEISKANWDSKEISWDFQANPLVANKKQNLETSCQQWLRQVSNDFFQLHANEEELNHIFIDMYGLQEVLTPDVLLKDITVLQEELDYEILQQIEKPYNGKSVPIHTDVVMQQLISYILGCYMGRYRLDKPGLHIAHPNFTEEDLVPYFVVTGKDKHYQFQIDDDAIIPLMGSNGNFTDDMLCRVNEFLTIIWGDDTLTVNLNFLQQQLNKDLDNYLVKDFWKFHTSTYNKKPIYWLFSSKKGAFQVLAYMHRINVYTPAKIRSKYLIPHISWLQNQVRDMEKNTAGLNRNELKKLDTLRKQRDECEEYDLLLKDIADKQISFDLDDGVTKNYALFKGVVAEIK